jgi:hypothetical protein
LELEKIHFSESGVNYVISKSRGMIAMKDMNPVNTTNADHYHKSETIDPAYLTKDPVPADTLNKAVFRIVVA